MTLISTDKFAKAIGLNKIPFVGKLLSLGLIKAMSLDKINSLYRKYSHLKSPEFETTLLDSLSITYTIDDIDLSRIPRSGPFILVSNHPLGGLDGIIMLKAISEVRPDFKIVANFILNEIKPLQARIFPVNPFTDRKDVKTTASGMRDAYKHVLNGKALGVFPAGEVSHRNKDYKIEDIPWRDPIMKLIQKANVPVIPMYFNARNSRLFYRLQKLHPRLQTAMLPREIFRTRRTPIAIRIGKPIAPSNQLKYKGLEEFSEFIRQKTYLLSLSYDKKPLQEKLQEKLQDKMPKKVKKIIAESDGIGILNEIKYLKEDKNSILLTKSSYQVFFTKAQPIPHILTEIGRLREVTFRAIGEGSMKKLDLDKYDQDYHHLILWDNDKNKIAGAYRMGMGAEIYKEKGIDGFYINSQFKFDEEIRPFFSRCIDMGRAFVVQEYQQKPLPLYLLWNGIIHVAMKNPEHTYLLGGVSVSKEFTAFTKSVMVEFIQSHYYNHKIAKHVHPIFEYKDKVKDEDKNLVLEETKDDINKLDKIIEELEPRGLRLPVLIKKYIKQNARVIGFNVDPHFNNSVGILMYIKVSDIPESTLKPVIDALSSEIQK